MKASTSTATDNLSMKTIKNLYKVLQLPILNLINSTIATSIYPNNLKLSKIVPLLKKNKPQNEVGSYRAINLLPTLSKIIDKSLNKQLLKFLIENNLIPHEHHGGINGNSTITAIATMLDMWSEAVEKGDELAIIILDQTAAYDIISHEILVKKMELLGFTQHTLELFKSYLKNRSQKVMVDGTTSEELFSGPTSVIQGSVMSCTMFLLYTLDLPYLFTETITKIEDYVTNKTPKPITFIDDVTVPVFLENDATDQEMLNSKMDTIEVYMKSNLLQLNRDKTQLIILSERAHPNENLFLRAHPKNVHPTKTFTYLGIEIEDTLKWNSFLDTSKNNIVNQLKKRLVALRHLKKFADLKIMKQYANGIFHSKVMYGAELWGGAPLYLKKRIQSLMSEAARIVLGLKLTDRWSTFKLMKEMNWLNLENLLTLSACRIIHQIIHKKRPVILAHKMSPKWSVGDIITRLSGPKKLGPRPKTVGRTKLTKYHFRAQAYTEWPKIHENIQKIKKPKTFKK